MRMTCLRTIITLSLVLAVLFSAGIASAEKTITITFTGDVTLGGVDNEQGRPDSFDNAVKDKGYDYFFSNFREMFEQDDLTVINLEGPLTDSRANKSGKLHVFRGNTEYAKILTKSGIDAASLSNNHVGDYGKQGETNTKKALDDNGIKWFQDFNYYLYEKDGVRIAFFALQNSVLYTQRAKFLKKIAEARETDKADAVIVCWHTGTEYKRYHDEDTERKVTGLIRDAGVDLIIINHPHVAQGMGVYNNRSVFYSLGNFVFGGNRNIRTGKVPKDPLAISLYGLVVQAKLTFSNDNQYLGQQMTAYPLFTTSTRPDYQPEGELTQKLLFANDFHPMRLTMEQAKAVYEIMKQDTTTVELPPMTERDGKAEIVFPYLPSFDGVLIPESDDTVDRAGAPGAPSAKPTRQKKNSTGK